MIYLNDPDKWPLQVVLRQFVVEGDKVGMVGLANVSANTDVNQISIRALKAGMITLTIAPLVLIYPAHPQILHQGHDVRRSEGMTTPSEPIFKLKGRPYPMLSKTKAILSAALLTSTCLGGAALAETATVRMVLKDFISTNPNSVAHVERIEAALARAKDMISISS